MIQAFVDQLPQLRAERQLAAIEAASIPYMTPELRDKVLDGYVRHIPKPRAKRATLADLVSLGIAVQAVPAKKTSEVKNGRRTREGKPHPRR